MCFNSIVIKIVGGHNRRLTCKAGIDMTTSALNDLLCGDLDYGNLLSDECVLG